MSIEWHNLRPLDGSQQKAFEELCCQLAGAEKLVSGSSFIRKAAPDAGVECYWKLSDESEWGWQAKFFLSPPGKPQWKQIDDSISTALDKHPHLSRYVVCLPIDRADPRIEGKSSFMSEWDKNVTKWRTWAASKGMAVTFEYWGEHEIFERLSMEEHHGRYYFWFNGDLFSHDWFMNRVEEAVANVGPRYTPELDVKLPIAYLFEGLGKTQEFVRRVRKIIKGIQEHVRHRPSVPSIPELDRLHVALDRIWALLETVSETPSQSVPWNTIIELTRQSTDDADACSEKLLALSEAKKPKNDSTKTDNESRRLKSLASNYRRLSHILPELIDFATSSEATLVNLPALLLAADAGRGKTHLFCDVAIRRVQSHRPTVLLIGGDFNLDEPWTQIIRQLGLSCTRDSLLGALEAAAQANGERALILIDALNEGQGKLLWTKYLAGFLLAVSRSTWLGISISVRTSYEDATIPEGLVPARLLRELHHGFADHEYEATKTFFDFFGIQRPSIPLLVPEFQNPLFLKIFCQGLKNSGLTTIPPGLHGITAVFEFFINSVNKKLSRNEYLDFNPGFPIIWRAVEAMATELAEQGLAWLALETAENVINKVLPREGYENSLFRHLVSEGVITENRFYDIEQNRYIEGVHFAYERFTDHLIAKHLLEKHLNADDPASAFDKDGQLFKYVQDQRTCAINQGLIEALSVQVPERVLKDLIELVPSIKGYGSVISAFIDSIIWRDPLSIDIKVATDYINSYVIRSSYHHYMLLNCLLTVAATPANPLNADFLHGNLMRLELPERDAWWSVFLHEQYGEHGAIDRLVDWAWSEEPKDHIADEAIRLSGLALVWFLTSSNRFLRDRTTKALVRVFTDRTDILRRIIRELAPVNDPYVLERLMAVSYGCALKTSDLEALASLATDVYELVFADSQPPVNILTRDYARGVVELAAFRGLVSDLDLSRIRPPYGSEFPKTIPTDDELKAKYDNYENAKRDIDYSQSTIWQSVMGWGDFARYIIGTNGSWFPWSSLKIGESPPPTKSQRYETFVESLTKLQRVALDRYRRVRVNVANYKRQTLENRKKQLNFEATDELLDSVLESEDKRFQKRLGKRKSAALSADLVHYIDFPHDDDFRFDLKVAQRWILQRVFDLGWSVERFGNFDRSLNYHYQGRGSRKAERIGKKYQWIAYYEFLARVADNFKMRKDSWRNQNEDIFDGPWQESYLRNIDPSCVIRKTGQGSGWGRFAPTWWSPIALSWNENLTDREWVRDPGDLPSVGQLIVTTEPVANSEWLTLESYFDWDNSPTDEDLRREYPFRQIKFWLQAYLITKTDSNDVYEWMKGNWRLFDPHFLPTSHGVSDIFLGEFFWSPAFLYHNIPYFHHDGWIGGQSGDEIPKPILLTTDQYSHSDSGYDCSVDESIQIHLPCKTISDEMSLNWKGTEGHYYNNRGDLIAFDPSVASVGPSALLASRDLFSQYLDEKSYDLLWVVSGEKLIITGDVPGNDWPGRLSFLGVFRMENKQLIGQLTTRIEE